MSRHREELSLIGIGFWLRWQIALSLSGGGADELIIITGDGNRVTLSSDEVPLEQQLQAYYRSLAIECSRLPLGVVEPNFTDSLSQDNVALNDVYTDLHVLSCLKVNVEEKGDMHAWGLHLARGEKAKNGLPDELRDLLPVRFVLGYIAK